MMEQYNVSEILSLSGKVAVVTGAASGIGLGAAKRLAEAGAAVALVDIDRVKGESAAREIKESGGTAQFYQCDVGSSEGCKSTVAAIQQTFGRIDILFNNAGIIRRKTVVDLEEKDWDAAISVTLKGVYLMSKYVVPVMQAQGGGSIINTGSGWGLKGGPQAVSYCAAKGGVVVMTRAMAIDHGKDNIRVNCVCPGDIDTPMLRDEARQLGVDEKEFLDSSADRPIRRLGTPLDVADAVLYFSSNMSKWVTGTALLVDGGGMA